MEREEELAKIEAYMALSDDEKAALRKTEMGKKLRAQEWRKKKGSKQGTQRKAMQNREKLRITVARAKWHQPFRG